MNAEEFLAWCCYVNTPESEIAGRTLEQFTADLQTEWVAMGETLLQS